MCGILGIISANNSCDVDRNKFKDSAMLMKHRGPDAYGQWGIQNKIELAHLRLAIIDLNSDSNQPFFSRCNNYVIVFNGEIYNYLEIKIELQAIGYDFLTASDTEVLLNSYIEWGEECVSKFNGDWSFAIYDVRINMLFCSRDRFGIKPFNYAVVAGKLIFSSEIKSILNYFPQLRCPNYNVISNFCRNGLGAQAEETWFHGIKRLLPAHTLTWKDGEISIKRYWEYPESTNSSLSLETAIETYREILLNSVKLRMRSDVAVGTTLSSGLDSSAIVSILRKFYGENHKTFTAVFNPEEFNDFEKITYRGDVEINEGDLVEKLAKDLSLESHLINIGNTGLVDELKKTIYHLESGHSSPATLPLSKIMDYAKDHVTVVMEGQGADELLGGYIQSNFPYLVIEYLKRGDLSQLIKEAKLFRKHYSISYSLKLFFRLLNNDIIERLYYMKCGLNKVFGPHLKTYTRIKDYPQGSPKFSEKFSEYLFRAHTGGLVNLLHYGDAISMSKSLESRNPFTDVNLVEFAFTLPFNYKMHNGLGKFIHRVSMNNIVPKYILDNPLKFGFNTPLSQHFDSLDKETNTILLSEKCLDRGIFDSGGLYKFIADHIDKKANNSTVLFRLLSVELWFRRFIDNP